MSAEVSSAEQGSSVVRAEVAYALPERQKIVEVDLPEGSSLRDAALKSGLDAQFDGLDLSKAKLGLFGKVVSKPEQQAIKNGDRVEIYRDLIADPKEVRKQRAAKVKAQKAAEKAAS